MAPQDLILGKLNPQQKIAVETTEGPLLVFAGAGSGKTRVITNRIAYLITQKKVPAESIMAVTFTKKAAGEMQERVLSLLKELNVDTKVVPLVGTFHSIGALFLRQNAEKIGLTPNFSIFDSDDSENLIKDIMVEKGMDIKQVKPQAVSYFISSAKNEMISPENFVNHYGGFLEDITAEIYPIYQKQLAVQNSVDFGDLLYLTVKILSEEKDVLEKYQEKYKYMMIDEYQDTNKVQYLLANLLAQKHQNICVVGDADQSIYGWRGADIKNIMDFEKDYPKAKVIKLEQNYRSTKMILAAANAVIENNFARKPKELWTENVIGDKITYYLANDERDEANFIATTILKHKTIFKTPYADIAVLYRTNAQSRVLEEAFMKQGLPYTMVGGLKFYDRKEIKDIFAYLRVIYNPNDNISLLRIINVPKRGIGDTSIGKLVEYANDNNMSLFDVISNPDLVPKLMARVRKPLELLAEFIFTMIALKDNMSVADLIDKVMKESGYIKELETENTTQSETRLENLKELLSLAKDYMKSNGLEDNLENFLSQVALVSDIDNVDLDEDKITMMTMHSAKGLEFPVAFIAGMEEGLFPHSRTLMNESEIEEERRICYVGITRARRKLYLTNAKMRTIYGKTVVYPNSRFLSEIPDHTVERLQARNNNYGFARSYAPSGQANATSPNVNTANLSPLAQKISQSSAKPDLNINWKVGDKAQHSKWGIGTIISVSGDGEEQELKIAFPNQGIKPLMKKYAPITKV